jgi:hypothetical protein
MSLEMLVYNPAASIFGRLYALVKWESAGHFRMDYHFSGLPAIEYSADVTKWKPSQMVPDLILVSIVFCYTVFTIHSTCSSWSIERKSRWRLRKRGNKEGPVNSDGDDDAEEIKAAKADEPNSFGKVEKRRDWMKRSKAYNNARFKPTTSLAIILFEVIHCALMLSAIAVWFVYAIQLANDQTFSTRINVYDADASTPCRPLLPYRNSTSLNTSSLPLPGHANRWKVPEDVTGMQQVARMQQQAASLDYWYTLYGFLQGFVLLMFPFRWLFLVGFQPRLSVIPGGLIRMFPDFVHLYLVAFICGLNLIMIWVIVYGTQQENVSTFYGAFIAFLYMVTAGVDQAYPYGKGLTNREVLAIEQVVIVAAHLLATILFIWFIKAMIITIIMWPFSILVHRGRKAQTVSRDLSSFFRWLYQSHMDRRNDNSHFLKLVDEALKEKNSEFRQAMVRIVAARALKKAFSEHEDKSHRPGLSDAWQILDRIKLNQSKSRLSMDGERSTANVGDMSIRLSQQRSSNAVAPSRPRALLKTYSAKTSNTLATKLATELTGSHMMDIALAPMEAPKKGLRNLDGQQLNLVSAVKFNLFSRLGGGGGGGGRVIPDMPRSSLPVSRQPLPSKQSLDFGFNRKMSEAGGGAMTSAVSKLKAARQVVRFSESGLMPQSSEPLISAQSSRYHFTASKLGRVASLSPNTSSKVLGTTSDLRVRKESSYGSTMAPLHHAGSGSSNNKDVSVEAEVSRP